VSLFERLNATPEWKEALQRNGWTEAYQPGPQFGEFLAQENDRVATVLKELGLA
jgi:putative tricarboxylic transport membrane protein